MSMTETLVLAVDIGTSSVRALVFDQGGRIRARRQRLYTTIRPEPYFEEQDPDLVRTEVFAAIRDLLSGGEVPAGEIASLGFSSQMYGIFPVDGEGRALANSIIWSDGRAEAQAERIKAEMGPLGLYPDTGCPANSIYPVAKLAWLKEERPEIFSRASRFVSIKEYVTAPLIGGWYADYSMASATGLLDIRRHVWKPEALAFCGLSAGRLSEPVSGLRPFALASGGPLSGLGLREDLPVFLGAGDGPLANLGSGASSVGAINIDLGTSGAARAICDTAVTDDQGSLWCFCLTEKLWAYGGIVTNVGNAYEWLGTKVLGQDASSAYDYMNDLAAATAPGADGLLVLPYLRKARSPYWDGRLKGTIYGLTPDHGAGHIARALLEAIGYDLRTILGLMAARIDTKPQIVFTGGLARSPLMPQLLADILEREIRTPENQEGSIAGAAIMALKGLDAIDGFSFSSSSPAAYRSFVPNGERSALYRATHARYSELVEAMRRIEIDSHKVLHSGSRS
jgi:gluconokinase